MKKVAIEEVFSFNRKSIDAASDQIVKFLESQETDSSLITKYRLLAEECLLVWMDRSVSENFRLSCGVRRGRIYMTLTAAGIPCNVLEINDADDSFLVNSFMQSIGLRPFYAYVKGQNILRFDIAVKRTHSQLTVIFASIALGLALGLVCQHLLPVEVSQFLLESFINPVYSTAFRLLGFVSGPLILFSVTWGIYGIGDAADFKQIGKDVLLHYLSIIFLLAIAVTAFFPLFRLNSAASEQSLSSLQEIVEMILDIVPSNIIEPLYTGNTLQIIFTAILLGIAMIFLRKRVTSFAEIVEQTNYIIQFLMECITKILPYFIFLIMVRLVLSDMLSVFGSVWKLFLIYLAAALSLCILFTVITCVKYRVSPVNIVKKSFPTFVIAFTTASSSAAFSSLLETSSKKFGIDESLSSFGLPLGMVMCKSSTVMYYVLISLFFAKQFDVSTSIPWVVTAAFVSAMLAIATPPIPGGGTSAYTMLFARLLIPNDALAIVLSMDIIFDFFRTAFNLYSLPLILMGSADSLGKLDKDKLRSKA